MMYEPQCRDCGFSFCNDLQLGYLCFNCIAAHDIQHEQWYLYGQISSEPSKQAPDTRMAKDENGKYYLKFCPKCEQKTNGTGHVCPTRKDDEDGDDYIDTLRKLP